MAKILIIHGAEDQQVPMDDARAMYECIGSKDKELKVFTGEDGGSTVCVGPGADCHNQCLTDLSS